LLSRFRLDILRLRRWAEGQYMSEVLTIAPEAAQRAVRSGVISGQFAMRDWGG
jgi:hypothetical protein